MMLAPSASRSMNATVLGDADMTLMRVYFVKPQAAIAMTFSDDPQMGMVTDRFTGIGHREAGDAILRDADRLAALSAGLQKQIASANSVSSSRKRGPIATALAIETWS